MIVAALGAAAIGQVLDGALLIVIFATSGALEALATARTADSVRGLLDLAPDHGHPAAGGRRRGDGADRASCRSGDMVLVRPGERIGADGRVLDGASEVDQATITGEPLPVAKAPGRRGVRRHPQRHRRTARPRRAGPGRLGDRPHRDAWSRRPPRPRRRTQLFIEKVEQRYARRHGRRHPRRLRASRCAFGADLTAALLRAMTFMIVASPCAVVLATMPPLLSAIANAGRHGVLVKSAVVMERLGEIDAVALDKTGTLTEGTPRVTDVRPLPGSGLDEDGLLALAAAAEHPSEHPLARAVVEAARERGLALVTDRGLNRLVDYPRHARAIADRYDVFHVVDHSYAQLVHYLPPGRTVVTCHDLDTFRRCSIPATNREACHSA